MNRENYYNADMVKLIATRFAKASRDKQDVTSNDTITHYEKWIAENGDNFRSVDYFEQAEQIQALIKEWDGLGSLISVRDVQIEVLIEQLTLNDIKPII